MINNALIIIFAAIILYHLVKLKDKEYSHIAKKKPIHNNIAKPRPVDILHKDEIIGTSKFKSGGNDSRLKDTMKPIRESDFDIEYEHNIEEEEIIAFSIENHPVYAGGATYEEMAQLEAVLSKNMGDEPENSVLDTMAKLSQTNLMDMMLEQIDINKSTVEQLMRKY